MKQFAEIAFRFGLTALLGSGTLAIAQGRGGPRVADAKPGDIRVMVTAAIRVPLEEVRAQAEQAVGHPLVIEYGSARGNLKDEILAGQAFEVAILLPDVNDELLKRGKIVPGSAEIARVPIAIPVSVSGDLWVLGNHRVLCGDATVSADVGRLLAGDLADLVFTDPPYNVDYEGYTEDRLKIKGDRMSDAEFRQFLEAAFRSVRSGVKAGGSLYVCHSSSWQREFQNALEQAGFEVRCQIIWAKNTFAWGFGRYKFQHEPLFYSHVTGQKDAWYGDKSQSTLWEEKKPAANRMHPTAKPVELIERALLNSSKAGDLVVDLFGGSGSTLIACERRNRKSRLMEIDPKYVDVIVRRYQEYSGKLATLDHDRRSFHDIAQERLKEAA